MGVTVVKGRAGSGKSRMLMGRIRDMIKDPLRKVLVIVPGQLTFETEKDIMAACGVRGIMGLEVLSLQRLALRILEETGLPVFLSHAERAMVCHRALERLDKPFGGERLPDFEVCLAELITRLKSHSQTPDTLRDAAAHVKDAALAQKLHDTADVLALYDEICGSRYDSADIYALAAARADSVAWLRGAAVVIDGLDSGAPAALSLLAKVAALAEETVAAFRGDDADPALFEPEEKLVRQFVRDVGTAGQNVMVMDSPNLNDRYNSNALRFLEANLYRYPYTPYTGETDGLYLIEAETAEQEVERVASAILAAVTQKGWRFSDIAVVGGNLAAYLPVIKSVFAQAGIPFFTDERRTLADNAFFDFLYSAMQAAAGDVTMVDSYAYSAYAPIDEAQRRALKSYADKYALKGWHFQNAFWRGEGAEEAEAARRAVMRPLDALTRRLKEGGAAGQVAAVRRFLDDCGVKEKLDAQCADIDAPETRAEHIYFRQVYERTLDVLDSVPRVMGDVPLAADALCSLISTGFEGTRIAVIPPATDEVKVFDISVARLPGVRALFAIGLNDGAWPARDDGPGILSGGERELLLDAGLDVGVYDLAAEKLKIYTALAKPKDRLVLSWNRAAGAPSVLIDRMRRLFPALQPGGAPMLLPMGGAEPVLLGGMADALRGKTPGDELPGLCVRFLARPEWRNWAKDVLLRDNAAQSLSVEDARVLYGGIRCSATRIENYYKCPYKHFLDHGVRAKVPRDYTYDRIDIGTYMHHALDLFAKRLIEDGVMIQTLSEEEAAERMETAAKEAAQQHDGGKLEADERFAVQYALLKKELTDTALRIRTHFMGREARMLMSEQTFTILLPTASGDVELTGKIDRIDAAEGYFRVVDYKSSDTRFVLNDLAAGTALQLPVYIEAARRALADTGLQPAGGYYMKIGDSYGEDEGEVLTKGRMRGISISDADALSLFSDTLPGGSFVAVDQRVTGKGALHGQSKNFFDAPQLDALLSFAQDMIRGAAERIYGGDNAICPVDGACDYCDYKSVCLLNAGYAGNAQRTAEPFDRERLNGDGEAAS